MCAKVQDLNTVPLAEGWPESFILELIYTFSPSGFGSVLRSTATHMYSRTDLFVLWRLGVFCCLNLTCCLIYGVTLVSVSEAAIHLPYQLAEEQ